MPNKKNYLAAILVLTLAFFTSAAGTMADTSTNTNTNLNSLSVPTNLMAIPVSSSEIDLSWGASTESSSTASSTMPAISYQVFRNGVQVATPSTTTFSDTGLNPMTSYTYSVSAFDDSGNTSDPSATVAATTSGSPGGTSATSSNLSIPINLTANPVSSSEIDLSWTASTESSSTASSTMPAVTYEIFRNGTQVGTPTTTTFADMGLSASTNYTYTVSAMDNLGNTSGSSASVSAMTLANSGTTSTSSSISIPINLTANPVSSSEIDLSWTASTESTTTGSSTPAISYMVFRNGAQIGSPTTTAFADTGLAAGTNYTYTVSAMDNMGNSSDNSASVSAETLQSTGSGGGTGTTTPPITITPPANGIWGWLAIPSNLYNQLYNSTSTSSSTSPFTYINGYPTLNGNYIDCNGNIDNDPAHHTTNPNDTDPGHHIGQNCPNGMPTISGNSNIIGGSSGVFNGQNGMFTLFDTNNQSSQWDLVPLTNSLIQKLFSASNPTP